MASLRFSCKVIDWYKSNPFSRKFHVNAYDKYLYLCLSTMQISTRILYWTFVIPVGY